MATDRIDDLLELRAFGDRLEALLAAGLAKAELTADDARTLLQEMATVVEELRVAEEEFQLQAEQLALANDALDAERERFADLFQHAPDGYLETDAWGRVLEVNAAGERLVGRRVTNIVGKPIQGFVARGDSQRFRTALSGIAAGAEPVTLEVEFGVGPDGPVPVEMLVAARQDNHGTTRLRWLVRDVAERRRVEAELRQLHAHVGLLDAFADVNRLTAEAPEPVESLLGTVAGMAVRSGAAESAAVWLPDDHRLSPTAPSAAAGDAAALAGVARASAEPGTQAAVSGRAVVCHGPDADRQWPELAAALGCHGLDWAVLQPFELSGGGTGVLALYGKESPRAAERMSPSLARHLAAVVGNARLYGSATVLARNLEVALESRGVIEQAKGILMAWQGCDADGAFDILRRASQRENRKLRVIAEEIVAKVGSGQGRRRA